MVIMNSCHAQAGSFIRYHNYLRVISLNSPYNSEDATYFVGK